MFSPKICPICRLVAGLALVFLTTCLAGLAAEGASSPVELPPSGTDPLTWLIANPGRLPATVKLKQPASFPLGINPAAGSTEVPAGTAVKVISLAADGITVQSGQAITILPVDETDLLDPYPTPTPEPTPVPVVTSAELPETPTIPGSPETGGFSEPAPGEDEAAPPAPTSTKSTVTSGPLKPRSSGRPRVLVSQEQRAELLEAIRTVPWMKSTYAEIRKNVDKYVDQHVKDPKWIISRLAMNWDTHYTDDVTDSRRWLRGEGHAPVPTPRFDGARDWASGTHDLGAVDAMPPYNDRHGQISAKNKKGKWEWVDPADTAMAIGRYNAGIMQKAADAAFVYWLTGEEKYAVFAADILWTYWYGFSFKNPPQASPGRDTVIGSTTFEVIHDSIIVPSAIAFDFLRDFLKKTNRDPTLIEKQFQRVADREIEGGGAVGNWNIFQARFITYLGMALEDDEAYENKKGRAHYADIVLNADLPRQRGLLKVIDEGYDAKTAIWPEAFGYGVTVADTMLGLATVLDHSGFASSLLDASILRRAVITQYELLFPDGLSNSVGDGEGQSSHPIQLELLLAHAQRAGDKVLASKLSAALQAEIAVGRYDRDKLRDPVALSFYLPTLPVVENPVPPVSSRMFYSEPFALVMLRNAGINPAASLGAALYGTKGGHTHTNGLSAEFFDAGFAVAPDPGRGSSYWQADHGEYFSQPPAHNTVIVNGATTYSRQNPPPFSVVAAEPASQAPAVSPNFGFAMADFDTPQPAARQRRLIALVRTSAEGGFMFDVFRSRATESGDQFHDYLYHGLGESIRAVNPSGGAISLGSTRQLGQSAKNLKGYGYFKNERSSVYDRDFCAQISSTLLGTMTSLWMPGNPQRTIFTVDAPRARVNQGEHAKEITKMPMPTLIVRQKGDAWANPFVTVLDAYPLAQKSPIRSVSRLNTSVKKGDVAIQVAESSGALTALIAPVEGEAAGPNWRFAGAFGAARIQDGRMAEIYLGEGTKFSIAGFTIESADEKPVSASLRRSAAGWEAFSTRAVRVTLPPAEAKTPLKQALVPSA